MSKLQIVGGNSLNGKLKIDSSKNACLPIFAASVLVKGKTVVKSVPKISDIDNMLAILANLGCKVKWQGDSVIIDSSKLINYEVTNEKAKEMRSSFFVLGSLLGRFKKAKIAYPGGCAIGNRPVDLHIKGFRDLGVKVTEKGGFIYCNAKNMQGGLIHLDFPSVGATENLIMAATLAIGTTKIINAAKEPEIVDLCNFINKCGGRISGVGTSTIVVEGVKQLNGCEYTPISDRIVAGTYLIAVAITGGKVEFSNVSYEHNESLILKLIQAGCRITNYDNKITIESSGKNISIGGIQTSPYPGFPTDLQSQIVALQTVSKGTSMVTENLFESRFKYVPELIRMGADITVRDRTAIIKGTEKLQGTEVSAADLRGGAALVLAGLVAQGQTTVEDAHHIYRGYQKIDTDLASLGANIIRMD